MTTYETAKYSFDGANITGLAGLNTGLIIPWSTTTAPSGFLECDGTAVSRSTYATLFAVVGTTYGVGNGTTTFNLPDLTDKTVVARSTANSKSLAQTGGANTVTPTGNIAGSTGSTTLSTCQIASHKHSFSTAGPTMNNPRYVAECVANTFATGGSKSCSGPISNTGGGQSHNHTLSANFAGSANSVLQPYLVLMYIIKT
jgi:microcystin-dependent protein